MPKIDLAAAPQRHGAGYPAPFNVPCAERVRQRLGSAGGLTDVGVNLMHLPPGSWSSQRHWHSAEDEFVYVLSGDLTLIEDGGETLLARAIARPFPKIPVTAITWPTIPAQWPAIWKSAPAHPPTLPSARISTS